MKPCPFCFADGRVQRQRGVAGEILFTIACTSDRCLAIGPIGKSEEDAVKKWEARNMNITMAPLKGKAK